MNEMYKKFLVAFAISAVTTVVLFASTLSIIRFTIDAGIEAKEIEEKSYVIDEDKALLALDIVENGGYILYFRHAHREKWIDVEMYDAAEAVQGRDGNEEYFKDAVCLSERGRIQARMMGEFIEEIGLPVGQLITSPSCRAEQTSEALFGRVGEIDPLLVHPGPFNESLVGFRESIKQRVLGMQAEEGKNAVISAHNSVIHEDIFDEMEVDIEFDLEEGGFYVMKNVDGKLVLIDKYHNYNDFNRLFFERPE